MQKNQLAIVSLCTYLSDFSCVKYQSHLKLYSSQFENQTEIIVYDVYTTRDYWIFRDVNLQRYTKI